MYNNNGKSTLLFYWILSTILLQQTITVKLQLYKLIISTWLLASLVIATSYGGCIYSLITLSNNKNIDTIHELIKAVRDNQVTLLLYNGSPFNNYLKVINSICKLGEID